MSYPPTAHKICPRCRKRMPLDAATCPCGHVFRTQFTGSLPPPSTGTATHPTQVTHGMVHGMPAYPVPQAPPPARPIPVQPTGPCRCAACGSEQVQKVTAICREGNWDTHGRGQTTGASILPNGQVVYAVADTRTYGRGQTRLAQQLAAPPHPDWGSTPRDGIYWGAGGAGVMLLVTLMVANNSAAGFWLTSGCALLAGLLVGYAVWESYRVRARERAGAVHYERARAEWQHQMARWEQLYYCSRCDVVFDPHTRRYAHPAQQWSLLR